MMPHRPLKKWTATAPTGSSMCNTWSKSHTPKQTSRPETIPTMIAPVASMTSQPAVIPTRPAREAFKHMETSGLPYFSQVKTMQTKVAIAGAMVVVTKIEPSCSTEVAAAPLNPYQPNQRMKQPKAPIVREWPGMALTLMLPFSSLVNLPIRGPRMDAPIRAHRPPTKWITPEPAKSWNGVSSVDSQPPPHTQWASTG